LRAESHGGQAIGRVISQAILLRTWCPALSCRAVRSAKGHENKQGHRDRNGGQTYDGGGFSPIEDKADKAQNESKRRSYENSQPAKG